MEADLLLTLIVSGGYEQKSTADLPHSPGLPDLDFYSIWVLKK